jgi:hypothetical protein
VSKVSPFALSGQSPHSPHQAIFGVLVGSFVRTEAINSLRHERTSRQSRYSLIEASTFRKQAPAGTECHRSLTLFPDLPHHCNPDEIDWFNHSALLPKYHYSSIRLMVPSPGLEPGWLFTDGF